MSLNILTRAITRPRLVDFFLKQLGIEPWTSLKTDQFPLGNLPQELLLGLEQSHHMKDISVLG